MESHMAARGGRCVPCILRVSGLIDLPYSQLRGSQQFGSMHAGARGPSSRICLQSRKSICFPYMVDDARLPLDLGRKSLIFTGKSMALQEVTSAFLKRLQSSPTPLQRAWSLQCRHYATAESAFVSEEMERSAFQNKTGKVPKEWDPAGRARRRNRQLPPSR